MKTLSIQIPESTDLDDHEAKMALASKLYERGKLTIGQAAELVGSTKQEFMQELADFGVNVINYPPADLDDDIANAETHSI